MGYGMQLPATPGVSYIQGVNGLSLYLFTCQTEINLTSSGSIRLILLKLSIGVVLDDAQPLKQNR
jgi:hypothetical protein